MNSPFTNFTGADFEVDDETKFFSNNEKIKSPFTDDSLNKEFEEKYYQNCRYEK